MDDRPLSRKDVVIAASVTLAIVGVVLIADPTSAVHETLRFGVLCDEGLVVTATNGMGDPWIGVPETAVKVTATADGELRPVVFALNRREAGEPWALYFTLIIDSGEHIFFVPETTAHSEVQVTARDRELPYCEAASPILTPDPSSGSPQ